MQIDDITLDRKLETITWSLLFIVWGLTLLFDAIPSGVGILGTGLILLGLNGARLLCNIPPKGRTTLLGILVLVWGGLEMARPVIQLPFELTGGKIVAIMVIMLGGISLGRSLNRPRTAGN